MFKTQKIFDSELLEDYLMIHRRQSQEQGPVQRLEVQGKREQLLTAPTVSNNFEYRYERGR